ncbi:MAG: polymer-forming cytoskeletal family protein [Phycisphaeraceae bacterium]|nr:MAG: polymer-forming cytoskeletal family protein [Phycisphaeraceae bacterium]
MADSGNQTTVIGADTHIKGEMSFDGHARILGTFEGKISAKGELHVAEGANCKASVEAGAVQVDGSVEGDLTARDRLQLNPKARIKGDMTAAKLVVAEGASFTGHCRIGPDAAKGGPAKGASGDDRVTETKSSSDANVQVKAGAAEPARSR